MSTNIISQVFNFNNTNIRSAVYNGQVYWSVVDVIESIYGQGKGNYNWSKIKKNEFGQSLPKWQQLKLQGSDGKMYLTDCAIEEDVYRILQSVNSEKRRPQVAAQRSYHNKPKEKGLYVKYNITANIIRQY